MNPKKLPTKGGSYKHPAPQKAPKPDDKRGKL